MAGCYNGHVYMLTCFLCFCHLQNCCSCMWASRRDIGKFCVRGSVDCQMCVYLWTECFCVCLFIYIYIYMGVCVYQMCAYMYYIILHTHTHIHTLNTTCFEICMLAHPVCLYVCPSTFGFPYTIYISHCIVWADFCSHLLGTACL